jgi:isopentenyl-diphosphate delta-isomerase
MKEQEVILVSAEDEAIGTMEKMEAHRLGLLHRAFSIFIFDSGGRMLVQQRAPGKYHGEGLWSNACCSHPYPGEETKVAATRRLEEELGFITPLRQIFSFTYRQEVENHLVEHEFDHVFAGEYEGKIIPNPKEVSDYRYESMAVLRKDLEENPARFTTWFRIAFPKIDVWWRERYKERV